MKKQEDKQNNQEKNQKNDGYSYVGSALTAGIMHSFVVSNSDIKGVMQYVFSTGETEYLREMMQIIKEKNKALADKIAKIQAAYVQEIFIEEDFQQHIAEEENQEKKITDFSDGILTLLEAGEFTFEVIESLVKGGINNPDLTHIVLNKALEEVLDNYQKYQTC